MIILQDISQCESRRSKCKQFHQEVMNEHICLKKLQFENNHLKEENDYLRQRLQEFLDQPTARDYAERS